MLPIVFINCSLHPFLDMIMADVKLDETRTRNTLRSVAGSRVLFAETGRGQPPLVRCSGILLDPVVIRSREEWDRLRSRHQVPAGSKYDWKPWTKVKYLYPITDIIAVVPFTPPEGVRHGRVWMEYDGAVQDAGDFRQWIADVYHCSGCWGKKMTAEDMKITLVESQREKFPGDYSPDPSMYRECAAYWSRLCDLFPN